MKISATSALVLNWCDLSLYNGPKVSAYVKSLDLSAGDELMRKLDDEHHYMHTQAVSCRKLFMWNEANKFLRQHPDGQVVILAAGIAPLSAGLADRFPNQRIWDIDLYLMKEKSAALSKDFGNITFITADLENVETWKSLLLESGYDTTKPGLFILEGIVYYLSTEGLHRILKAINEFNATAVGDFVIHPELVNPLTRRFPAEVFAMVSLISGQDNIQFYDPPSFTKLITDSGFSGIRFTPLSEVQVERTGSEAPFINADSAWIYLWETN